MNIHHALKMLPVRVVDCSRSMADHHDLGFAAAWTAVWRGELSHGPEAADERWVAGEAQDARKCDGLTTGLMSDMFAGCRCCQIDVVR